MEYPEQSLTINQLVRNAHEGAKSKGFYGVPEGQNIPLKLALIHSEISEALEELRAHPNPNYLWHQTNGKPEGFLVELADAVIRLADLVGYVSSLLPKGTAQLSFGEIIEMKMDFNQGREQLHGKKF
jgi:hypothetical protein